MTGKRTPPTSKLPSSPYRKPADASKEVTSERIAAHLAAFAAAGGTIEVLGVTRTLKHIDALEVVQATTASNK
jgi:hypothetical protein